MTNFNDCNNCVTWFTVYHHSSKHRWEVSTQAKLKRKYGSDHHIVKEGTGQPADIHTAPQAFGSFYVN